MTIKLKELMVLERILLEFEVKYKFELDFGDAYKLHVYLNKVGKITSYAFLIQDEFHNKYNDTEKLKEYNNKIMDSTVYFNYGDIVKFIDELNERFKDEKISSLILNNMFWA
jgi:hypothetical protein